MRTSFAPTIPPRQQRTARTTPQCSAARARAPPTRDPTGLRRIRAPLIASWDPPTAPLPATMPPLAPTARATTQRTALSVTASAAAKPHDADPTTSGQRTTSSQNARRPRQNRSTCASALYWSPAMPCRLQRASLTTVRDPRARNRPLDLSTQLKRSRFCELPPRRSPAPHDRAPQWRFRDDRSLTSDTRHEASTSIPREPPHRTTAGDPPAYGTRVAPHSLHRRGQYTRALYKKFSFTFVCGWGGEGGGPNNPLDPRRLQKLPYTGKSTTLFGSPTSHAPVESTTPPEPRDH
jgi:hypothetical protein